jgi:DNA primase
MNRNTRFVIHLGVIPVLMWVLSGPAMAAEHEHDHHHGQDQAKLTLNDGKKWATDAPLREGMAHIAAAMETHMKTTHKVKTDEDQHAALAREINAQVNHIFQNCRLDKQADAMLHLILADVMEGSAIIEGKKPKAKREDGIMTVVHALENYREHFEHPNFKTPTPHAH